MENQTKKALQITFSFKNGKEITIFTEHDPAVINTVRNALIAEEGHAVYFPDIENALFCIKSSEIVTVKMADFQINQ